MLSDEGVWRMRELIPTAGQAGDMCQCAYSCVAPWPLSRVVAMADETRSYFEEIRRQLAEVRDGSTELRGEFQEMRRDVTARFEVMDRKVDALDRKVYTESQETRRQFGAIAEALRDDIRTVAEGVVANTEAIATLGSGMDARFRASDAVVQAAFAELRRDIEDLRARL